MQLDERLWLLELFHGPTLAFKDLALQLVGPLFDAVLARRGERVTIVGATSGDTGSAAIEACRDRAAIDIFILYPHGRISEVQRRQMTTVDAANAHAIAIEGTFDDCQDLVKALFADRASAPRPQPVGGQLDQLGADRGADRLLRRRRRWRSARPDRAVVVRRADRQFRQCLCRAPGARAWACRSSGWSSAPTRNDILARYLDERRHDDRARSSPSLSPSMDIQVASNFERLLFELNGRDGAAVAARDRRVPRAPARCRRTTRPGGGARALRRRTGSTTRRRSPTIADTYRRDRRC